MMSGGTGRPVNRTCVQLETGPMRAALSEGAAPEAEILLERGEG